MPLIQTPHTTIRIKLSDRVFNDTIIKQEAVFTGLRHEQDENSGVNTVFVSILVKAYGNDQGEYGVYLGTKGISDRRFDLVGDNNTLVDALTGDILAIRTLPFDTPEWLATVDSFEQPTMLQGDFFGVVRDNENINIGALIRQHIAQADAAGKFA